MDPVERRLEKLDSELANLTAKEEAAWNAFVRASNPQQKTKLKERYERLLKEKGDCLSQRHDLHLKLPSSGEHTARPALAALPLQTLSVVGIAISPSAVLRYKSFLSAPKSILTAGLPEARFIWEDSMLSACRRFSGLLRCQAARLKQSKACPLCQQACHCDFAAVSVVSICWQ